MADQYHGSVSSPTEKYRRLSTSFLSSPMSPTSILDSKPFSGFRNPQEQKRHWDKLDSKGILAIVDDRSNPNSPKPESRMVLFGSHLKVQIPTMLLSPAESPKSSPDFDVKTQSSLAKKSPFGSGVCREMELSEDYTCVITHGPNPRTTHIFDNCVIESCCGVFGFSASKKENGALASESFLSFCHACKKHLGQGDDIYMYRGEKAFCSVECRCQGMLMEEEGGADRLDANDDDNVYGACSL